MLKKLLMGRRKAQDAEQDIDLPPEGFDEALGEIDAVQANEFVKKRLAIRLPRFGSSGQKADYVTVASTSELLDLNAKRVLVGGSLLSTAMRADIVPPKGFVTQMPREGSSPLDRLLKKSNTRLFLAVHPLLQDFARQRFAYLPDAYLSWGLRQKQGFYALIGGIEKADESFQVDIMVFNSGSLIDLFDMTVPGREDFRFESSAQVIIESIRGKYPAAKIALAAPLSDWHMPSVAYEGTAPLKRLSFKPLERSGTARRDLILPGAVAAFALCSYAGAIVAGWNSYSGEVKKYDRIASGADLQKLGGIDSNYIAVMTQRRLFMETKRRQDLMPARMLEIVKGIGVVQGVQILEMRLPAPSLSVATTPGMVVVPEGAKEGEGSEGTAERVPDALLRLSVPKTAAPALEQAKELMTTLRGSTGMTLRLIHRGWQDDNVRRTFTIEGFLNG